MRKLNYLNAGCGSKFHPDWTNIDLMHPSPDVISHNLIKGIPFEDNTFDVVYNAHFLEHLPKYAAPAFINECARVLRPGGIIRIVVPDLENIAREYLRALDEVEQSCNRETSANYEWIMLELFDQFVRTSSGGEMAETLKSECLVNENYIFERMGLSGMSIRNTFLQRERKRSFKSLYQKFRGITFTEVMSTISKLSKRLLPSKRKRIEAFRNGGEVHQWMYDRYSLGKLLQKFDFEDIAVKSATESNIPEWNTYQLDSIDGILFDPVSLFLEARKRISYDNSISQKSNRVL